MLLAVNNDKPFIHYRNEYQIYEALKLSKTNDVHNKKTHSGFPPTTPFLGQNPQVDTGTKKDFKSWSWGHQTKLDNLLQLQTSRNSDHMGPTFHGEVAQKIIDSNMPDRWGYVK